MATNWKIVVLKTLQCGTSASKIVVSPGYRYSSMFSIIADLSLFVIYDPDFVQKDWLVPGLK